MAINYKRDDAAQSLKKALAPIERTVELTESQSIEKSTDLPEAFPAVARKLPLIRKTLKHIQDKLKDPPAQGVNDNKDGNVYSKVVDMNNNACNIASRLENLFESVATSGNIDEKMGRYRATVRQGDKQPLETTMALLLDTIIKWTSMLSECQKEHLEELQQALREVKQLPPSLQEDNSRHGNYIANNSSGTQLNHLGSGNVNNNAGGGPQFTGDSQNPTYNFTSSSREGRTQAD